MFSWSASGTNERELTFGILGHNAFVWSLLLIKRVLMYAIGQEFLSRFEQLSAISWRKNILQHIGGVYHFIVLMYQ